MIEFKLSNGVMMPSMGLGTFRLEPEVAENTVREALKMGYRLIDTANGYANERAVGRGIRDSGVPRSEVFVITKIWPTEYQNPNAVDETLERLGLDYIDLLFIHHPSAHWEDGYRMLEKAYREGKVRAIGASNFEDGDFYEQLMKIVEIKPHVHQVECHPLYPQEPLRQKAEPEGARIMCWFPLGGREHNDSLLDHETVLRLAKKHQKSPAQILLRWHVQMGFVPIPGSSNLEHMRDNLNIYDFALGEEDMAEMAKLNRGYKIHYYRPGRLEYYAETPPEYEIE